MENRSAENLPVKLHNNQKRKIAVQQRATLDGAEVPHLGTNEIRMIAEAAKDASYSPTKGKRDALLVKVLFDACLRCTEALSIRPQDVFEDSGRWAILIEGAKKKAKRRTAVAISASLGSQLKAFAYDSQIQPTDQMFKITRYRLHQILQRAIRQAGIIKPEHVGAVHVLRHSGAIERLRMTGNAPAVQAQLRHESMAMTMRYFKTLSREQSMAIQQEVDFQW